MLCSFDRLLVTDILGQPVRPVFKRQGVQENFSWTAWPSKNGDLSVFVNNQIVCYTFRHNVIGCICKCWICQESFTTDHISAGTEYSGNEWFSFNQVWVRLTWVLHWTMGLLVHCHQFTPLSQASEGLQFVCDQTYELTDAFDKWMWTQTQYVYLIYII